LGGSIFLYEKSEKIGPQMICRPPRFQLMRFTLTTTLKNNLKKYIQNFFNILKPFSAESPDWGIRWKIKKIKNFPWAITNTPLGYYNRSPPGLDPNTPWYTE
jgi:hypothetical protein